MTIQRINSVSMEQILHKLNSLADILRDAVIRQAATALKAHTQQEQSVTHRTSVDSGALMMALNVLRRAGKTEVADVLEESAVCLERKTGCKECEEHRRVQLADKEWREDVARGKKIIRGISVSVPSDPMNKILKG